MDFKSIKKYVINLERRPDRLEQFQSQGIPAERFIAFDKKDTPYRGRLKAGQYCCKISHRTVIENAMHESIMIIEDDAVFAEGVEGLFNDAIKDLPVDWDMLYLGAHHFRKPSHIKGSIYRCNVALSTVCYMVNSKAFKRIYKELNRDGILDVIYTNIIQNQLNCYAILPNIVVQRNGYSDIENVDVDYSKYYNKWHSHLKS